MPEEVLFTADALAKKREYLEYLKTEKQKEIAERIEIARGFGDLSENSEYTEAKEAQSQLLGEIAALEERLRYAKIVSEDDRVDGIIGIGSIVEVKEIEDGEVVDEYTLTICGDAEEDPFHNKISYLSPIGAALMTHSAGDRVDAEVPMGILTFEILSVRHE